MPLSISSQSSQQGAAMKAGGRCGACRVEALRRRISQIADLTARHPPVTRHPCCVARRPDGRQWRRDSDQAPYSISSAWKLLPTNRKRRKNPGSWLIAKIVGNPVETIPSRYCTPCIVYKIQHTEAMLSNGPATRKDSALTSAVCVEYVVLLPPPPDLLFVGDGKEEGAIQRERYCACRKVAMLSSPYYPIPSGGGGMMDRDGLDRMTTTASAASEGVREFAVSAFPLSSYCAAQDRLDATRHERGAEVSVSSCREKGRHPPCQLSRALDMLQPQ